MKVFQEQYKHQIKQLADDMRNKTMPPLSEELFALFETTGNRLNYENVYFERRKFLAVFGIASYMLKQPADVEKLEEVLQEICREECWALPAHVNRRENPAWRLSVDLFAAETAQALAEIVTLVGEGANGADGSGKTPRLSTGICATAKSEIERRVLIPFEQNRQGWECSDHNWNAVCGGAIGSAALHLLSGKEEERLEQLLQRICHSLDFYLDGFREDGACMEGIGYFTYGMTYFTGFAEQLLRYSKGKINLFAKEKVRNIAEFQQKMYFKSGQTVSFSDGDRRAKFRMGLTAFLAGQYDTVKLPDRKFACNFETDPCYRFMGLLRDYEWTKETDDWIAAGSECRKAEDDGKTVARDTLGVPRHDILPYAQWSICESNGGAAFAIKGGHNGEPHNHNDVGSFLYLIDGEQLICDLGAGEYTAEYFGPGRYGILCNSSEGHSVPIVCGTFQKDGRKYKAARFEADGIGNTKIEFSEAYAEGLIEQLTREASFSFEDGGLTVTDLFTIPVGTKEKTMYFTENLVTQGTVILQKNTVLIQGKHASCRVQIMEKAENLRVLDKIHFNHEGEQETVRLIQWDVVPEQKISLWEEKGEAVHGVSKYLIRQG